MHLLTPQISFDDHSVHWAIPRQLPPLPQPAARVLGGNRVKGRAAWARRVDVVLGVLLISLVLIAVPAVRGLRLAAAEADVAESSATPVPDAEVALDGVREASEVRFTSNRDAAATPAPTVEPAPAEATPLPSDEVSFENPPPPPPPAPTDPPAPPPAQPPAVVATAPPPAPARTPLVALPGETIYEDEYFAEVHKSGTFGSTITIREVTVTASRLPAGSDFGQCPMENPPPGTAPVGYEVTVAWSGVYLDSVMIPPSVEAGFWCSENEGSGLVSGRPDRYWLFQYPGDTLTIMVNPNNTYLSYHWHWTD